MSAVEEALRLPPPRRVALGWAFVERQTNLWKRYWLWEVVWVVYGVVNTLAITFIAKEAALSGAVRAGQISRLTLFLLIGTLVWAYLSAVLDDMSLVITWERWEASTNRFLAYRYTCGKTASGPTGKPSIEIGGLDPCST